MTSDFHPGRREAAERRPLHEVVEAYRQHERGVHRLCRRYLDSAEAADDATQETFLRASVLLRTVQPDVLGAYLNTIARKVCLEELRRRRRRGRDVDTGAAVTAVADPETVVVARSFIDQVWRGLSTRDRTLFILRLAGYSYAEIAQRLRISVKAVDVGLTRARQNARRLLDGMPALLAWPSLVWRRRRRGRARRPRSIALLRGAGRSAAWKLALAVAVLPALPAAPALWHLAGTSPAAGDQLAALTGAAMAPAAGPLSGIELSSLAVSPSYGRDRTVYGAGRRVDCASTCPVLVRSGDGGHSWQALPARGFGGGTVLLAPRRAAGPIVFAAGPDGLERSDDGGSTFRTVVRTAGPIAVGPASSQGGALVAIGVKRITLYHVGDGAVTVGPALPAGTRAVGLGFTADGLHLLVAALQFRTSAPAQSSVLRCGFAGQCVPVLVDSQAYPFRLLALPAAHGVAIVAAQRLYLASPDGAAVRLAHLFAGEDLALVAASANGPAGVRLVAALQRSAGGPARLAFSLDLGRSFTAAGRSEIPAGITALAVAPDGRAIVAVAVGVADLARDSGLRCSPDGGATWRQRC